MARTSVNFGSLIEPLKEASNRLNISMNSIVVLAVREWLQNKGLFKN